MNDARPHPLDAVRPVPPVVLDGPSTAAKLTAEFCGTFLLVLSGVGAALFAASYGASSNGTSWGIGFVGVAFLAGFASRRLFDGVKR